MKKYIFDNGLKLIYEYKSGDITSFTIGFNAGALEEPGFPLGTAHVLEHMLFKGTNKRSEDEINIECDRIFGFNNAMTNYPYAIYYGTLMSEEFERGIELFADIIRNPILNEKGFKEEINVIFEELKEWKDDPYQYCEDELFYNSFEKRRIKHPIIGTVHSVDEVSTEDLKKFYSKYYVPANCVVSVVSSLDFKIILDIIAKYYEDWKSSSVLLNDITYEDNREGIYIKPHAVSGAKICYCYDIHKLNEDEIIDMIILNNVLGSGTSSILYDAVRTKYGLAYDVSSIVKNERGIKLLEISLGTSYNNALKAVDIINSCIERIEKNERLLDKNGIDDAVKSVRLRRMVGLEKSIELSKAIATYELMYSASEKVYKDMEALKYTSKDKILKTAKKVLSKPSIQIIGQ